MPDGDLDPDSPGPAAVPRSPLAIPLFRAVWITTLAANVGVMIQAVGAAWLMTELTSSAEMVALVQTATAAPIVLLSLWAGAVADNLDRRHVIIAAQGLTLAAALALAGAAWLGWLSPWLLIALTFLVGCGTAINGPAWQASVGDMVPRPALAGAVALNSMGFNIARSFGPALGGAIVAVAGAAGAFVVNALSTLGLIAVMLRWRRPVVPRPLPRERLGMAMAAGLRYVAMAPPIRLIALRSACFGVPASAIPALLPIVARHLIGGGVLTYGVLLGSFGGGAVIGALLNGRLRRWLAAEWLTQFACVTLAAGAVVAGSTGILLLTAAGLVVAGIGWVTAFSSFIIGVQLSSPRWVVGRALAIFQTATFAGLTLGSWASGVVAAGFGVDTALFVAAALLMLVAALGLRWPLPAMREQNLDLQDLWREPATAIPIEHRSGPIVVTVEHRIATPDIVAFLTVMQERRRIRRRDGARHWTLLRDLSERDLWIERYTVPTWLDYIRHNQRRTHADSANEAAIRALWMPGAKSVVRRRIERQLGPWARH